METLKKYSHLIYIIIILTLITFLLTKNKTINESQSEIDKLQTIIENQENINTEEIDTENTKVEDTFEDDIKWFISKIYEANDLTTLYDDIKNTVNQNVLETLVGEEIPPKKDEIQEYVLEREVTDIDVYGKYINDGLYKALVSFNVFYDFNEQSQDKKTLVSLEIKEEDGAWIISEFEEFSE